MLLLRVGLPALILFSTACSSDKKNDRSAPPVATPTEEKAESAPLQISLQTTATLDFAYGDYFTGYKSYRYDTTSHSLTGNWDRLRATNDPEDPGEMVRATASLTLSAENRQEIESLVAGLNKAVVIIDKSDCGSLTDGPINSIVVTEKSTELEIRIADAAHVLDTCADSYVAKKSLDPVLGLFMKLLPQPEDDSAYKPL